MGEINRMIPFRLRPAAWGLDPEGKTYRRAEAEYYFNGEDRDRKLAEIDHEDDPFELELTNFKLDIKYRRIDPETKIPFRLLPAARGLTGDSYQRAEIEYLYSGEDKERKLAEIDFRDRPKALKLRMIELDLKYGKLVGSEGDKMRSNLKGEPYMTCITSYDPRRGSNGCHFKFDYNEFWIQLLRDDGYEGVEDDDVMEDWFNTICRSIIEDKFVDLSEEIHSEKGNPRTKIRRHDDGIMEIS